MDTGSSNNGSSSRETANSKAGETAEINDRRAVWVTNFYLKKFSSARKKAKVRSLRSTMISLLAYATLR